MSDAPDVESAEARTRQIDPFSFFATHASAIPGFGGSESSPDARYCFHTPYLDIAPGRARFHLNLEGASATRGELTVRVQAFRPGADAEVGMAAAGKLYLSEFDGDAVDHVLRFTALEGLQYALFAFFTEPTDLTVDSIGITVEEMGGHVPVPANLDNETRSRLAQSAYPTSHRLVGVLAPSMALSLSQPLPIDVRDAGAVRAQGGGLLKKDVHPFRQVEIDAALRALDLSTIDARGVRGLLVDPPSRAFEGELVRHAIDVDRLVLSASRDADLDTGYYGAERDGAYDFVISHAMANAGATAEERLQVVGAGLRCLRGRGIGIFLMPFWTGTAHDPSPAPECLDRNAIQQIALRLIGQRYSISQLAFPPPSRDGGEITSFILIAHKLA